jgi:transposase
VALQCFDGLTRRAALAFLQAFPTPEAARQADVGQVGAVLRRVQSPGVAAKAASLHELVRRPQLEASAGLVRAKARLTLALVAQLQALVEHIAAYDQAITQLFTQHADHALFASLPGAGRRLARRLLAEWGDDRARSASAASVQALAGTAPVLFHSGASRRVRRRVAGVNAWRQALSHCAHESVLLEEWARASYRRKREQGKTRAMALRALANQWVRII